MGIARNRCDFGRLVLWLWAIIGLVGWIVLHRSLLYAEWRLTTTNGRRRTWAIICFNAVRGCHRRSLRCLVSPLIDSVRSLGAAKIEHATHTEEKQ